VNRFAPVLFLLLPVALCFAQKQSDPWSKVADLKGGTDLRVYKTGSVQPVVASFADLNDDNLIVVIKNTETAIPRSDIDRIDARPKGGSRVKSDTRETEKPPDQTSLNPREQTGPSTSSSTNVQFGSKGDFETVYRRTASMPPAAKPAPQP
jgi:hypothetical protein